MKEEKKREAQVLSPEEEPMELQPLIVHLRQLRKTVMFCLIAVTLAVIIVFLALFTDVAEGFSAQVKLSVIVGIVCASPLVFAAIWLFVRPGLKRKERKKALIYIAVAAVLFVAGVWFAYRYVFFLAVNFFIQTGDVFAEPMLSIGTYINFLLGFLPPFGVMFELPVVIIWLTGLGLVTSAQFKKARKFVILGLFVIAAILTPPDVVSQVMLGMPLLVLYEVDILCAKVVENKKKSNE